MNFKLVIIVIFLLPFSFAFAQTQDSTDIPHNDIITDTNVIISNTGVNNENADSENITADTNTKKTKIQSPKIAGWMSTGVPGLGQIYIKNIGNCLLFMAFWAD